MSNDNPGAVASGTPSAGPNQVQGQGGQRPWTAGRIIVLILGSLLLLVSLGIGSAAGFLALADKGLRDGQGYFMSGQESLSSSGYAVVSERVDLHLQGGGRFVPDRVIGDVKFTATPRGDTPIFIGIARAADAAAYLAGVQHSVVLDFNSFDSRAGDPSYRQEAGGPPAQAPEQLDIWSAKASGTGRQSLIWPVESGDWAVVVMNADATSPVFAEVSGGATFPGLGWVVWILLAIAACLLVLAIVLMVAALRTRTRRPPDTGAPVRQTAGP